MCGRNRVKYESQEKRRCGHYRMNTISFFQEHLLEILGPTVHVYPTIQVVVSNYLRF